MRKRTACFTGHRCIPKDEIENLTKHLTDEVRNLIAQGYCYFGAGGALGFDIIAEQVVLQLRNEYPQIKLILVLPCLTQADRWSEKDRAVYEDIKAKADKVVYTSKSYTRDCMFKRNRHLVDCSSLCICYLTKPTGGTAYTVKYAKAKGIATVNLA